MANSDARGTRRLFSAEGARALRKILSDAIIPADVVRRLEASGVRPDRLKTVS